MKKPEMKVKISRRVFNLFVILLMGAGALFAWQTVGKLQNDAKTIEKSDKPITVKATGRGNPFVNFTDGIDLTAPNEANGTAAKNLVSADFDSDGVADLMTADVSGNLRFFKGNELRNEEIEPFELTDKSFNLNISPDYIFAGDFNADGFSDVLASAKGANFLAVLSGDGQGNFSVPQAFSINGNLTAIEAGEIGRRDGQTDLAIAFTNKSGAFLAVFEHPESAFKYKPEIFKLSAPATEIAVGNLDEDFYADIAVASGNILTIVHGRGQAYPWDLIPQSGIERPKAFVASRQMPFAISAMTIGRFGTKRGETMTILGADGNIYRLEPNRAEKPSNNRLKPEMLTRTSRNLFLPADAETRNLAILTEPQMSAEQAENGGKILFDSNEISDGKFGEFLQKKQTEAAEKYQQMTKEEREKLLSDAVPKKAEFKERAKQGYLRSIAGKPSTLAAWTIETLVSDSSLASVSASNSPQKMLKVNVSSSNLDDILLVDSNNRQLSFVLRPSSVEKSEGQRTKDEGQMQITNLETEGNPLAVLPMRLNFDALSDLVVLRENSGVPSVVMTAPMNIFVVTSETEDGDCHGANLCSLRNAILLANQTPGVDAIFFTIGSATIVPESPLPVISEGVTISGPINGNNQPLVEISGTNLSGQGVDGLKIRTSSAAILGLAVNEFTSIYDPDTGSSFGGNGITIESTVGSPNNGNNFIAGNYLGTDKTGSLDKGNGAAGLNIFDADNNQINNNVISGNGSPLVRGVGISVTAGNNNIFHGNIIGLNSLGTGKLGNSQGVFLTGANNDFGGDGAGQSNTVSGNGESYPSPSTACFGFGMTIPMLVSLDTAELLTLNNNIKGNRMGTNPAGTIGLGNCWKALSTGPLTQTIVGSITQTGRNIISDNGYDGVYCGEFVAILGDASTGGFCAISGNNIGTDITGNIALPNDRRNQLPGFIFATGAAEIQNNLSFSNLGAPGGTTPNGACTGFCNLISGNIGNFYAAGATGYGTVAIFNNFVGLNQNGNQALPNENTIGIVSTNTFGETYVGLGVPNLTLGNVISANGYANIDTGTGGGIGGLFQTSYIHGNFIGTDSSGTFSVELEPSGFNYGNTGITASSSFGDTIFIGAGNIEARNVIAGLKGIQNGAGAGIEIFVSNGSIKILNNLIGLNRSLQPLGNLGGGMRIFGPVGANSVQIGGTDEEANQIAYNGSNGRNFAGVLINSGAQGTTVRNNLIHDNIGLGIDLNFAGTFFEGDGITANDCQDADFGANGLQNFPILFEPELLPDGTVSVGGFLGSQPLGEYTIDFYASPAADESGYGEGKNYLGSITIETDGNGARDFEFFSSEPVPAGSMITATATDGYGSTSEFSQAAGASPVAAAYRTLENFRANAPQGATCSEAIVVNVTGDEPDVTGDSVCDVDTSTNNGLQCTLRAAIQESERRTGFNLITFDIPGAVNTEIILTQELPPITQPVSINGTTQLGYSGLPIVKISGENLGTGKTGLKITGGGSQIRGLAIGNFAEGVGIELSGGGNNTIENTFIVLAMTGILINNSNGNQIGGFTQQSRNATNFNYVGVSINGNNNKVTKTDFVSNTIGLNIKGGEGNQIGLIPQGGNIFNKSDIAGVLLSDFNPPTSEDFESRLIGKRGKTETEIKAEIERLRPIFERADANAKAYSARTPNIAASAFGLRATKNNSVTGNFFGINLDAPTNQKNYIGIEIDAAESNTVKNNKIAAQETTGILITENGENNVIGTANYIGTIDGATPNGSPAGMTIFGSKNRIERNLISGNSGVGVIIIPKDDNAPAPRENVLIDNRIGTNLTGDAALPNGNFGIAIEGTRNQIIGTGSRPNIISGNGDGIRLLSGSTENIIKGNLIGVGINGSTAIPNQRHGITVIGSNNQIFGNTLSGNIDAGLAIARIGETLPDDAKNNKIQGNRIGTDATGNFAVPNTKVGIVVSDGADNNLIGGATNGARNIISGNTKVGIFVGLSVDLPNGTRPIRTKIQGNYIGTDITGMLALGNQHSGILIAHANETLVGGFEAEMPLARNVISANGRSGIDVTMSDTSENRISGNYIGTTADGAGNLGNTLWGVVFHNGAHHNLVGGTEENSGNTVAFNKYGVAALNTAGCCNKIDPNSIFGNTNRGISLGCPMEAEEGEDVPDAEICSLEALPNDEFDADEGGNRRQNYPEITTQTIDMNGDLIVSYKVDSSPENSDYGTQGLYLEFFKSDIRGQGEQFLNFDYYTETDYNSFVPGVKTINLGNAALLGFGTNDKVTVTATDANGNTSEFFPPVFTPTAAEVSVSGQIFSANGTSISRATLILSDENGQIRTAISSAFGYFRFENVEVGRTYIVSVRHKRYIFNPRVLTVNDEISDLVLTAEP